MQAASSICWVAKAQATVQTKLDHTSCLASGRQLVYDHMASGKHYALQLASMCLQQQLCLLQQLTYICGTFAVLRRTWSGTRC